MVASQVDLHTLHTQTSSFQASTCYPQTPTFLRPGLCQTTMFQELLEAVSNLGFFDNLPKENLKIAYGFVEDLRPSNYLWNRWWWMMDDDGWMMDEWWMNDDDDDDGWWMMDENPPNFRQCFLASWTLGSVFRGPEPTMLAQHKGITPAYYETLKTTPDTPTWLHQQFQGQRPILRCRMQDPFIGTGNSCARFKVW